MRVGTPGFVAQRLTEAREARGLAQTALSELTGIKSQSISHYEQGRQSPSPEALALLCEKLDLPERYFLRPAFPPSRNGIFFRSIRPQARAIHVRAERRLGWLREIAGYVKRHVDLPQVQVPEHPLAPEARDTSSEIERIADECRQQLRLGFGPLAGTVLLAENLGCVAAHAFPVCEHEAACSQWDGDNPYILMAGDACPAHTRFDIAHELGHMVMHRRCQPAAADADTHRILEQQADRFARAFLLPARTFGREVWAPTIDAVLALRKPWNCPASAMILRCGELGAFDADQVRRASANLARRGWKSDEMTDSHTAGEEPQLLARAIRMLIESAVIDRHTLRTDLSLNSADIESLAGLPRNYLTESERLMPATLKLRGVGINPVPA